MLWATEVGPHLGHDVQALHLCPRVTADGYYIRLVQETGQALQLCWRMCVDCYRFRLPEETAVHARYKPPAVAETVLVLAQH